MDMEKLTTLNCRKVKQVSTLIVENNAEHWLIIRSALAQCFPEVKPVWVNNAAQIVTYLENASPNERNPPADSSGVIHTLPGRRHGPDKVYQNSSGLPADTGCCPEPFWGANRHRDLLLQSVVYLKNLSPGKHKPAPDHKSTNFCYG